jgi:hypothetical protein
MKVQATSILYTPLFSKGTIRGAFLTYWWQTHHHFDKTELRLAEGVDDQLALALENASLFTAARKAERRSALLAAKARAGAKCSRQCARYAPGGPSSIRPCFTQFSRVVGRTGRMVAKGEP